MSNSFDSSVSFAGHTEPQYKDFVANMLSSNSTNAKACHYSQPAKYTCRPTKLVVGNWEKQECHSKSTSTTRGGSSVSPPHPLQETKYNLGGTAQEALLLTHVFI